MEYLSYADPQLSELPQEWGWRGMFPRGCMTEIYGPGAKQKGLALAELIGRWTRGDCMPDGTTGFDGPRTVVSITAEDRRRQAMAMRYRVAGVNRRFVFDLSEPDGKRFKLNEQGQGQIRQLVETINAHKWGTPFESVPDVGVIYIDPLFGVAPCNLSDNVRFRETVVEPLDSMADDYDCVVGLVNHSTKDEKVVAGSAAAVQGPRMVLGVRTDDKRPDVRQMYIFKTNLWDDQAEPFRYRKVVNGDDVGIEWLTPFAGSGDSGLQVASGPRRLRVVPATPPPPLTPAQIFRNLRKFA
jgi:AAA domain